jgi:hypothetical protein
MTVKNAAQVGHVILLYVILEINPADRDNEFPNVSRCMSSGYALDSRLACGNSDQSVYRCISPHRVRRGRVSVVVIMFLNGDNSEAGKLYKLISIEKATYMRAYSPQGSSTRVQKRKLLKTVWDWWMVMMGVEPTHRATKFTL